MTEENRTVVFYDIFIAGPGDVRKERFYIRNKILLWTRDNAEATGIHLRPRMWELDSPGGTWPKDPERPEKNSSQWIIDEKVVKRCDYLLAIFADRLGTPPDDKYPSGTAREIDIHASANKPSKIFFCVSPYKNDDAEGLEERQRLDEYRRRIERQEFSWIAAYHSYRRKRFKNRFDRQFDLLIEEIKNRAVQDGAQIANRLQPQEKALSKHEIEILKYAFQSPGYRFATRCTREGKYLITPAASKKPKPSEVLNADGNDKTNMLYKAAIKSLEEERKYIEKYRDPFQNCQFYELSALKLETIEKVLATGPTLVPKTTGKPVLVDEINPLDCSNTFDKIAQKIIFGAYRYGTHFWAITILCTQTTYFLAGEKQTPFLTCTLNEATEAIERLKEECLIKDLIFIEPNDGYAYILRQLGLQEFKQRLDILGEPLDIASGAHRITKEGRLYCQQFGNANDSK